MTIESTERNGRQFRGLICMLVACALLHVAGEARAQEGTTLVPEPWAAPFVPPPAAAQPRLMAFISDLHFGLGRQPDGKWFPQEDFRWPKALAGFLQKLSELGRDHVDLVIVGDFLELWQPPVEVTCVGAGAEAGCTVAEMVRIVEAVLAAHRDDLALLREFAMRGENRLHVIPGNHDSALLLSAVWKLVSAALGAENGRIALVKSGVWVSPDGRVVAEHGHQVGSDVNRYAAWPRITTEVGSATYLVRPWGERFVQRMFNSQEAEYEVIDNVAPETVGVKYRMADRGFVQSIADVAQFIAFNLYATSFSQKLDALGAPGSADADKERWDLTAAREQVSYNLFLGALSEDDPMRSQIAGSDSRAQELKSELAALARDKTRLSDNDVRALCDHLEMRGSTPKCGVPTAGFARETLLVPRRHVMRDHVADHLKIDERMQIFIYGHTHALEKGWPLAIKQGMELMVHNTGAFQRTIDEEGFLRRMRARNLVPHEALRAIKLEELPPCYSAVLVIYREGIPESKTWRWHMPEDGAGSLVEPDDERCE